MAKEGSNRGWVRNLRSGSVAQFLNTMTLCFVFFGMVCNRVNLCNSQYRFNISQHLIRISIQYYYQSKYFNESKQGLTKSLINLQVEMERKEGPSQKETANSVGYVVGFVFGRISIYLKLIYNQQKKKSKIMRLYMHKDV